MAGFVGGTRDPEKLFFFSLITFTIGYFLLGIQHSWGANYNYPIPQYVLGRYLMHLTPLYFIAAIVALYTLSKHISFFKGSSIVMIVLVSFIKHKVAMAFLRG